MAVKLTVWVSMGLHSNKEGTTTHGLKRVSLVDGLAPSHTEEQGGWIYSAVSTDLEFRWEWGRYWVWSCGGIEWPLGTILGHEIE